MIVRRTRPRREWRRPRQVYQPDASGSEATRPRCLSEVRNGAGTYRSAGSGVAQAVDVPDASGDLRDQPGSCPICGMALEPMMVTTEQEDDAELRDMTPRFGSAPC